MRTSIEQIETTYGQADALERGRAARIQAFGHGLGTPRPFVPFRPPPRGNDSYGGEHPWAFARHKHWAGRTPPTPG